MFELEEKVGFEAKNESSARTMARGWWWWDTTNRVVSGSVPKETRKFKTRGSARIKEVMELRQR